MKMLLFLIGIFFVGLYYLMKNNNTYWKSRGIPFEQPFLIFGCFFDVIKRKQHFSERIREIYDKFEGHPYVGIHIFHTPTLMVRSPELLKQILIKDFATFVNRPIASNEQVDPISFNTLFSAKDGTWRNLRSKLSPVFTSGKMKLMLPLMKECVRDLIFHLENHEGEINIRNLIKMCTVDVISSCAFGIKSDCLKNSNSEILKMANQLLDFKSTIRNISIFSFFFLPQLVTLFRLTFADKTATQFFINLFHDTMRQREKMNIQRNDLVDLLKNLRLKDSGEFDDTKMAAQAVVFFSAGNDPTALVLSFVFYELAKNRDIQNRLRKELLENCDDDGDLSYEALIKMEYLDMVLKETHRKYPLTTFLQREASSDYTIKETNFTIKKGDKILVPLTGLHYDSKYHPNPDEFDPERFNEENKSKITPYTYLPFGDGPRNCIGERFANLVSKIVLAYVIKDFLLELGDSTRVPLELDPTSLFLQSKQDIILKVDKLNKDY